MSNDENDISVFGTKEEARKKATKLTQSGYALIFKYLEELGFPSDLLLDEK